MADDKNVRSCDSETTPNPWYFTPPGLFKNDDASCSRNFGKRSWATVRAVRHHNAARGQKCIQTFSRHEMIRLIESAPRVCHSLAKTIDTQWMLCAACCFVFMLAQPEGLTVNTVWIRDGNLQQLLRYSLVTAKKIILRVSHAIMTRSGVCQPQCPLNCFPVTRSSCGITAPSVPHDAVSESQSNKDLTEHKNSYIGCPSKRLMFPLCFSNVDLYFKVCQYTVTSVITSFFFFSGVKLNQHREVFGAMKWEQRVGFTRVWLAVRFNSTL